MWEISNFPYKHISEKTPLKMWILQRNARDIAGLQFSPSHYIIPCLHIISIVWVSRSFVECFNILYIISSPSVLVEIILQCHIVWWKSEADDLTRWKFKSRFLIGWNLKYCSFWLVELALYHFLIGWTFS